MDKVRLYYHRETDSMDIWFEKPLDEISCEEVGERTIVKKNKLGKIIGIEKLYVMKTLGISHQLPVEIVMS